METETGDQCISLIAKRQFAYTEDTTPDETTLLGAPFFRMFAIRLDYETNEITIWSKNVTSPLDSLDNDDDDDNDNDDDDNKLSTGAIVGISIGSVLFVVIVAVIVAVACKKPTRKEEHYADLMTS